MPPGYGYSGKPTQPGWVGEFENCERYRLVQRHETIPANMLPNGKLLPIARKGNE